MKRLARTQPAPDRPPGYFLEPVTRPSEAHPNGWPPGFVSQVEITRDAEASAMSSASRAKRVEAGTDFGSVLVKPGAGRQGARHDGPRRRHVAG